MKRKVGSDWQLRVSTLGCVVVMMVLASATVSAAPIVVDPGATPCVTPSVHFTTIQAAIDAASPGATIQICPGQYREQISIYKPLTLKGVGAGSGSVPTILLPADFVPNAVVFGGRSVVAQVVVQSQDVTLMNLIVDGKNELNDCDHPRLIGILYGWASGALKHVSVRNQFVIDSGSQAYCGLGLGIHAQDSSLTVQDSDISNVDAVGISYDKGTVDVRSNVIIVRGSDAPRVNTDLSGIVFSNSSGTVSGNFISQFPGRNREHEQGIFVLRPTAAVTITNNVISNFMIQCNTCDGVTVSGNKLYGDVSINFGIEGCGTGNLIQSNEIIGSDTNSGWTGISVVPCGPGNTVTLNTLQGMTYGIVAQPGVVVTRNKFTNVGTNIFTFQ